MNQYKSKADKIRAYVSKHPHAKPKEVAKATKSSYGYAYKTMRDMQGEIILRETIREHVKETTVSSKPKRTTRKLRVCWKRLVKKVRSWIS